MATNMIDISIKTLEDLFIISLRCNEKVANLRLLVAARLQQMVQNILLIFGGKLLSDVGNIDEFGITSNVIVHVLLRQRPATTNPAIAVRHSTRVFVERIKKRDRLVARVEATSDGFKCLERYSQIVQDNLANTVARKYQVMSVSQQGNPQRGYINNQPLPNAWILKSKVKPYTDLSNIAPFVARVRRMLRKGDIATALTESDQMKPVEIKVQNVLGGVHTPMTKSVLPKIVFTCYKTSATKVVKVNNVLNITIDKDFDTRYATELMQLTQMGFSNWERNVCALSIYRGNVENAAKLLNNWKA